MVADRLVLAELSRLVSAERHRRGMSLRDAAEDIGIPFNTLARVERGSVPDVDKFMRLVQWCGIDITRFFQSQEKSSATIDLIAEHLRLDRSLSEESAEQLITIIEQLYSTLARPQEVATVHLRAAKTVRPDAARVLGSILSDLNEALSKGGV